MINGPIFLNEDEKMVFFDFLKILADYGYEPIDEDSSLGRKVPAFDFIVVGRHEMCEGWLKLVAVSRTHNVIFCDACHLRIKFPKEVNTYGRLRQWCALEVANQEARTKLIDAVIGKTVAGLGRQLQG